MGAPSPLSENLTGGHAKMMLAYGHRLSYGHQGFGPFILVLIIEKQQGQWGQQ